ncbi:hypothetical protein [Nocardioides pacificus]
MSAATAGIVRAREWVDHLRAGGTTPWLEWRGPVETDVDPASARSVPAEQLLPGAQQLELVRRINLESASGAPAELVERVLTASAPGRGALDLPLVGVSDGDPFGARPVDPATIPAPELLRLATGLIADDAASSTAPASPAVDPAVDPAVAPAVDPGPTPRSLPWRRRPQFVGDPLLAGVLRDQLVAQRYAPGRVDVLVLGGDLEHLLGAVWTARVVAGKAVSWSAFCHSWAERDRLPPRADLAALAATWSRRGRRVRIVTDPTALSRLMRTRRALAIPPPVPAAAAEIAQRVSQVLGVLVPAEQRPALTRAVLASASAAARPTPRGASPQDSGLQDSGLQLPPVVPAECRPWLLEQAGRQRESLAAAEYPVHGRLETLLPAESPATHERPDAAALTVAVRMLLDTGPRSIHQGPGSIHQGPRSIHQGERRETRDQA